MARNLGPADTDVLAGMGDQLLRKHIWKRCSFRFLFGSLGINCTGQQTDLSPWGPDFVPGWGNLRRHVDIRPGKCGAAHVSNNGDFMGHGARNYLGGNRVRP